MPVAGGGFEQCYNAQAAVAAGSLLVVAAQVVQAPNDKQQIEPMLDKIGLCRTRLAGRTRCWRTMATSARPMCRLCAAARIDPMIALGRRGASSVPVGALCRGASGARRPRRRSKP